MARIHEKTIIDLQFPTVLEQIAELCTTELGKECLLELRPLDRKSDIIAALHRTSEYQSSYDNNNAFPAHTFEDIRSDLSFLKIEDSTLELAAMRRIYTVAIRTNELYHFIAKFEDYYPYLNSYIQELTPTKEIAQAIDKVVDKYGEIKDNASADLQEIRRSMQFTRGKINQSFGQALVHYNQLGYLDDIKESVVENRRVLAVLAMYRRKVRGSLLGSSKTGSIAFIEPEATLKYSRELAVLEYDEKEEIKRILKQLSTQIRPFVEVLDDYQAFLTSIDTIAARAKYAQKTKSILPEISNEKIIHLREAYHPLLWITNKNQGKPIYAQNFDLDQENRIIVISGPNAGGKTIALKTMGLLQLMLQSGILIPVHPRSKTFLFERVLTDIGDNQSIENHLSTYSYRLKNMNYFLKRCNDKTLFLIDEFGTGSDPELGGALAEVFLEEFYEKQAFGIITTHYANLKMLASELPEATNANMLFDEKSLEPMYKLVIGQAGSSFTFEVAQKNGIPYGLINRAKKKVEHGKVRFDKTIANLQKERAKLEKQTDQLKTESEKAKTENQQMEATNLRIRQKLEGFQELYDSHQKQVYLGQKLDELALRYFNNKNKKDLIAELLKVVEVENSKRKKVEKEKAAIVKAKQEEKEKKALLTEMKTEIVQIREEKKAKKEEEKRKPNQPHLPLKVGDRVRMLDGRAVGTLEGIEKNKATVNYGIFTSKVNLNELELVQAIKK